MKNILFLITLTFFSSVNARDISHNEFVDCFFPDQTFLEELNGIMLDLMLEDKAISLSSPYIDEQGKIWPPRLWRLRREFKAISISAIRDNPEEYINFFHTIQDSATKVLFENFWYSLKKAIAYNHRSGVSQFYVPRMGVFRLARTGFNEYQIKLNPSTDIIHTVDYVPDTTSCQNINAPISIIPTIYGSLDVGPEKNHSLKFNVLGNKYLMRSISYGNEGDSYYDTDWKPVSKGIYSLSEAANTFVVINDLSVITRLMECGLDIRHLS